MDRFIAKNSKELGINHGLIEIVDNVAMPGGGGHILLFQTQKNISGTWLLRIV